MLKDAGFKTVKDLVPTNPDSIIYCKMKVRYTTELFVSKAIAIHGKKYNYNESLYVDYYTKIIIICPLHGSYEQLPSNHLRGHGCDKCAKDNLSKQFISNATDFIVKANTTHNDYYNYSKIIYRGNKVKIEIICREHGIFTQTPANHLTGYGCPKCGGSYKLDTRYFIEKSNKIHNNKYNYELTNYKSNHSKIIIICQDHGQFTQEPAAHMGGQGCPNCGINISKTETEWLDSLNIDQIYRHKTIKVGNIRFWVDAYVQDTNTVYEFNGDFWHGNPKMFNPDQINNKNKKSFGELYDSTIFKEKTLIEAGYNIISIWESDWKKGQKLCKQPASSAE